MSGYIKLWKQPLRCAVTGHKCEPGLSQINHEYIRYMFYVLVGVGFSTFSYNVAHITLYCRQLIMWGKQCHSWNMRFVLYCKPECGLVGSLLDSRSKDLRLSSHCWSCVWVSGKLLILYCLSLPSSDGYLVGKNRGRSLPPYCLDSRFGEFAFGVLNASLHARWLHSVGYRLLRWGLKFFNTILE